MSASEPRDSEYRLLLRTLDVLAEELDVLRKGLLNPDDDPAEKRPDWRAA
jgi:hypothetical protein